MGQAPGMPPGGGGGSANNSGGMTGNNTNNVNSQQKLMNKIDQMQSSNNNNQNNTLDGGDFQAIRSNKRSDSRDNRPPYRPNGDLDDSRYAIRLRMSNV